MQTDKIGPNFYSQECQCMYKLYLHCIINKHFRGSCELLNKHETWVRAINHLSVSPNWNLDLGASLGLGLGLAELGLGLVLDNKKHDFRTVIS